jgi:hypothetical protein
MSDEVQEVRYNGELIALAQVTPDGVVYSTPEHPGAWTLLEGVSTVADAKVRLVEFMRRLRRKRRK